MIIAAAKTRMTQAYTAPTANGCGTRRRWRASIIGSSAVASTTPTNSKNRTSLSR